MGAKIRLLGGLGLAGWFLAARLGLVGFRGGRRLLLLHTTLMLPLVDGDDLVDQGVKLFFFSDSGESILNRVFETEIKEDMLGIVVEIEGHNDLLEFDRVRSGRLGLLKARQLVSRLVLEVAVKVKRIKSLLESRKIVTMGMVFVLENRTSQSAGVTREVGNDKKYLLMVFAVLTGLHREREETLGHESAILRDFAVELVRLVHFRFAT